MRSGNGCEVDGGLFSVTALVSWESETWIGLQMLDFGVATPESHVPVPVIKHNEID